MGSGSVNNFVPFDNEALYKPMTMEISDISSVMSWILLDLHTQRERVSPIL